MNINKQIEDKIKKSENYLKKIKKADEIYNFEENHKNSKDFINRIKQQ